MNNDIQLKTKKKKKSHDEVERKKRKKKEIPEGVQMRETFIPPGGVPGQQANADSRGLLCLTAPERREIGREGEVGGGGRTSEKAKKKKKLGGRIQNDPARGPSLEVRTQTQAGRRLAEAAKKKAPKPKKKAGGRAAGESSRDLPLGPEAKRGTKKKRGSGKLWARRSQKHQKKRKGKNPLPSGHEPPLFSPYVDPARPRQRGEKGGGGASWTHTRRRTHPRPMSLCVCVRAARSRNVIDSRLRTAPTFATRAAARRRRHAISTIQSLIIERCSLHPLVARISDSVSFAHAHQ